MVRPLLISFVFLFSLEFSSAQSTLQDFQKLSILSNSSLEKAMYANLTKGLSPFHAISVLYSININSIKISPEASAQFIAALRNTKGVIDCFLDSKSFMLYVKSEKEINYVRIEQIKEVMQLHTNLQIEKYKEELFTNE